MSIPNWLRRILLMPQRWKVYDFWGNFEGCVYARNKTRAQMFAAMYFSSIVVKLDE